MFFKSTSLLLFLSLIGYTKALTCILQVRFIDQIFNSIDFILQPTINTVHRMSKLISTTPFERYYIAPYSGEPLSENSTRQLLWADCFAANWFNVHSPSAVALAGPNNWLQMYAHRKTKNQYIITHRKVDTVPFTIQPLNYYYDIDQNGLPSNTTADTQTTPDFNTSGRVYYINATKSTVPVGPDGNPSIVSTIYSSKGVGGIVINFAKLTNISVAGVIQSYVPFAEYNFKYFDDLLAENAGSYLVAYIMDTKWGYLYATSRGFELDLKQYATTSPDSYISASAKYIRDNGITTDTDRWVPELGYAIQTRFYTSPDGGLQWTLVSATSDGAVVMDTSDDSDDKIDIIYDISIAVLSFVFISFLIACYSLYNVCNSQKTTSLASSDSKRVQM